MKRRQFCYPYPRPAVTVDVAVFTTDPVRPGTIPPLRVLLIRRGDDPFAGRWALPGGFVDQDEDLADAARRELIEETGLGVPLGPQLGAYGTPGRDPRGHTVSAVYLAWVAERPAVQAGDDAADARFHDARRPPGLAFDHRVVLRDAVAHLRSLHGMRDDEPWLSMLPGTFSLGDAARLRAAALGTELDTALRAATLRRLRGSAALRELPRSGREPRFSLRSRGR
ncbi:MAG: NUDIX hydrolase [Planctomycetes bacterium]|nr:NUDIX hydrolase [Planctomycetota bacterium]MCB9868847.1 NUDIX hydrolase [Planctomycetota bacterium]MCB9889561.1 NUDIX hydrolase [Planctomycetota bacterium]